MLFLRVPTSDKHPRQGSPPQTPACWAKRGSHRLAFPRSGKSRALGAAGGCCAARGAPGSIPGYRCSGSLSPGQHSPGPVLLRGRSRAGNEYLHPLEKRSSPPPGRAEAGAEARYPSRMRMSPSRGWLLAQVCSAFVSLDYQLGLGKRPRASR